MAGTRTENKIYEVGMYCRLSKDDGTDNESASIATQKSILTDYVKKQGWHLAKTYVDDGYSGTNFQTVRQEIKIYYKFIGFVGELHITPTKRWTALKPKNCTVCGVEYVPCSAISKYCPECRKKIRKVRGTETKRRSRERNRQACIELSAKNDRLTLNSRRDVFSDRVTEMIPCLFFVM